MTGPSHGKRIPLASGSRPAMQQNDTEYCSAEVSQRRRTNLGGRFQAPTDSSKKVDDVVLEESTRSPIAWSAIQRGRKARARGRGFLAPHIVIDDVGGGGHGRCALELRHHHIPGMLICNLNLQKKLAIR